MLQMSAPGYPYNVQGTRVVSRVNNALGIVHGVRLTADASEPLTPFLDWQHELQTGLSAQDHVTRIYRDGQFEDAVTGATKTQVAAIYNSKPVQFHLEQVSVLDDQTQDSEDFFHVTKSGQNVSLNWPTCDASDFNSYKVYWDEGDGNDADVLLVEKFGTANTSHRTGTLSSATYQFALAMKDVAGNESAIGTVESIIVNAPPLALTGPTISYNGTTRLATISSTMPAGQPSNIAGSVFYDNYIPGVTLSDRVNMDYWFRRDLSYATGAGSAVSFVTRELFLGQWYFTHRAIDENGVESTGTIFTLNLTLDGATLESASVAPFAPLALIAYPTADADIVIQWWHDGANVTKYNLYTGGTINSTSTTALTTDPHKATLTGLVDATQYTLRVTAANGGVESPFSPIATATADGTAPACNRTVTASIT